MSNARAAVRKKSRKTTTMAEQADRHVLYQKSVQTPDVEIEFFQKRFKELRGRKPSVLREDFCGTAYLCSEWVKQNKKNRSIGVDICEDTLNWGREHNIAPLGNETASRISLHNENVLTVTTEPADVLCAMNFSYCIFETRDLMRQYFENARRGLNDEGLMFLDLLGGTATVDVSEEEREIDDEDFSYIWEQATFNPINHHMDCFIHFVFPDGSRMEKAFSYSWRLWSIPEINELLLEAGFSKVHFYWEEFVDDDDDPDSEYMVGTGDYVEVTDVEQQESWIVYIVAEK